MERKEFLKKSLLGAAATSLGAVIINELKANPLSAEQVGFNHIHIQKI